MLKSGVGSLRQIRKGKQKDDLGVLRPGNRLVEAGNSTSQDVTTLDGEAGSPLVTMSS